MSAGGSPESDHPTIDDLADAAEDLLEPGLSSRVRAHLTGCGRCRSAAAALTQVTTVLAAEPAPPVPAAVSARLRAILQEESARRLAAARRPAADLPAGSRSRPGATGAHTRTPQRHASLGHFGHDLPRPAAWRRAAPLLVAAVLALVVGLGGSVLSATAGLGEPPVATAALRSTDLADQARTLAQVRDLDPHRFSDAWFCARQATRGRITGLAGAWVDGSPALLVYTRGVDADSVTVVAGCRGLQPTAVASAVLSR